MITYWLDITVHLFRSVSVLVFVIFLISKTKILKNLILKQDITYSKKLVLIFLFGGISALGVDMNPVLHAVANTQPVGIIAGGLTGGLTVGIGAGVLAGLHRLLVGGISVYDNVVAFLLSGTLAGLMSGKLRDRQERWPYAFGITLVLELVHLCLLAVLPSAYDADVAHFSVIGPPMVLINSLGVAAFIAILDSLRSEQEKVEGQAAKLALQIANKTLAYLRKGLDVSSARQTVRIIYERVGNLSAVAITSHDKILAFQGMPDAYHHSELGGVLTDSTKRVLETGEWLVMQQKSEIGCPYPECPLASKVVVPLIADGNVVGALVLYKAVEYGITPFETELAVGLGHLISTQIQLSSGELQAELRTKAELKALQAQINPHFLFNAINTIVYYCRKQPDTARKLLIHLAQYYRSTIAMEDMADLRTEILHVESYVAIEVARFHGKLKVIYDIPPECHCRLPALTLQPIVENAIKHGIYPRKQGGTVVITAACLLHGVIVKVEDDGIGMDKATLARVLEYSPHKKMIGLSNVNGRLRGLYGPEAGLTIVSEKGRGTCVLIAVPAERSGEYAESPGS